MSHQEVPAVPHPPDEQQAEAWREGMTMALYISLSLLAVMVALSPDDATSKSTLITTLALISAGLVLAHLVAFALSSRLVNATSELEPFAVRLIGAQVLGGIIVTLVAILPIAVFGASAYTASIGLLLAFILAVAYLVARSGNRSRGRALLYVAIIAVVVVAVLWVKSLAGH